MKTLYFLSTELDTFCYAVMTFLIFLFRKKKNIIYLYFPLISLLSIVTIHRHRTFTHTTFFLAFTCDVLSCNHSSDYLPNNRFSNDGKNNRKPGSFLCWMSTPFSPKNNSVACVMRTTAIAILVACTLVVDAFQPQK